MKCWFCITVYFIVCVVCRRPGLVHCNLIHLTLNRRLLSGPVYLFNRWDSLSRDSLLIGPRDRQVITSTVGLLEEERGAAAADAAVRDDGDTIAQNIRFIHVMCRQNDGSTWKRHRHQTNTRSVLVGARKTIKVQQRACISEAHLNGTGAFEVQVHWKTARSIYRRFYISLCIEKFPVFCIRRSSRWSQTPAGLSIISALLCDEAVGVQDGCPLTCREQKYHEISCICTSQRQTSNLAEKLVFISRDTDVGRCKAAIWTQRLYKLNEMKMCLLESCI